MSFLSLPIAGSPGRHLVATEGAGVRRHVERFREGRASPLLLAGGHEKAPVPEGNRGPGRSASATLGYPARGPGAACALEVPTRTPPPQNRCHSRPRDHLLLGRAIWVSGPNPAGRRSAPHRPETAAPSRGSTLIPIVGQAAFPCQIAARCGRRRARRRGSSCPPVSRPANRARRIVAPGRRRARRRRSSPRPSARPANRRPAAGRWRGRSSSRPSARPANRRPAAGRWRDSPAATGAATCRILRRRHADEARPTRPVEPPAVGAPGESSPGPRPMARRMAS